jgi:hypothetical protein
MRSCIFCGTTDGMTGEDVLPKWLRPYLVRSQTPAGVPMATGGSRVTHHYTPPAGFAENAWSSDRKEPAVITRAICQDCNTGWMSRLESEAKGILSPLVTGTATTLSAADQRTAAVWAVKTALCFEAARPAGVRAPFHAQLALQLYRERLPRPEDKIVLGATEGGPAVWQESSVERTSTTASPDQLAVLFSALSVGNLLIVTVLPDPGANAQRISRARFSGSLPCIWPSDVPVHWPPFPAIGPVELSLAAIARRL